MGKRFTATEKWADPWWFGLAPKDKLAWQYLCDYCDAAGVIDLQRTLANVLIGEPVDWDAFIELSGKRLRKLPNGKYWLTGFIDFQYGTLTANNNLHRSVLRLLEKHGINPGAPEPLTVPSSGDQEKVKVKVKEQEKESEGGCKGETDLPPVLDSPEFRSVLDKWRAYKGRAYKPRGLSSLVSQAAKRAEQFGLAAVVNAFETAIGNGYDGWNFDASFRSSANGRRNDIGPGQRYDPAAAQGASHGF